MTLVCALAGCGEPVATIYCGSALCHEHWVMTDEIPDEWQYDMRAVMKILGDADDSMFMFVDEPDEPTRRFKALRAACAMFAKQESARINPPINPLEAT